MLSANPCTCSLTHSQLPWGPPPAAAACKRGRGRGRGRRWPCPLSTLRPALPWGPSSSSVLGSPQGLGWGPSCGGRPCWRSLPFSDFCLDPLSGSCLVQPSWLPERNWSSCLRLPLASGAGLPERGGPPAAPAGLGRGTGLLRNVAPPGGAAGPGPPFPRWSWALPLRRGHLPSPHPFSTGRGPWGSVTRQERVL